MAFSAPTPRRERILAFGRSNSGKSSTWLSIADFIAKTQSTSHMYVLDSDRSWDVMRPDDGSLDPYVTVFNWDGDDFTRKIEWVKDVKSKVRPDDWVVVDMIHPTWDEAQAHYFYIRTGGDMLADVYLKNQEAIDSKQVGMGGDHGSNWGVIKRFYSGFMQPLINMPCHVLCVAGAKEIRADSPGELKGKYGEKGMYPEGKADLPGHFLTEVQMVQTPSKWVVKTIREKGPLGRAKREYLKGVEVPEYGGFAGVYLMNIAGWTV